MQTALLNQLMIQNPKYVEAQSAGRSVRGLNQYITNFMVLPDDSILVPRGMRQWILNLCREMGVDVKVADNRKVFDFIDINSSKIKFRPYQSKAIVDLVGGPEGVLVAPAGSGKTIVGLSTIAMVGQPTLWLTHTGPLAAQAAERAETFLPNIGKIGLIGKGKWEKGDVLTIGMVQTLVRNLDELYKMQNDFGLLILDEAHHCPARTFLDVVCQFNPYYMYGLTATPRRRDKLEALMFHALGMRKIVIPIEEVSSYGGIMVPTVIFRPIHSPIIEDNDIQKILKKYVVESRGRNRIIVEDVLKEARRGKYCIVVSDRRKHCETLYKAISRHWNKSGIATGKYTKKYVLEQVKAFNDEEITVLVTTSSLLGEGFDVPFLDRAFITMPFRSETKTEQIIGRIQRSHPGKEDAVVYDYVDVNIGILMNQFYNKRRDCRHRTYSRLGVTVENFN